MNVIVQSKTLPVTAALREFVAAQASKLSRLGVRISKLYVYLEKVSKKNNDPFASSVKFKIHMPGKDVVVGHKAVDMYEAIVAASASAVRHVRKLKEKRMQKRRLFTRQHLQELSATY